jgi:hypothetical protein
MGGGALTQCVGMGSGIANAWPAACQSESESESESKYSMKKKGTEEETYTGMSSTAEQQKVVTSSTGGLLRFLFKPPRLGPLPPTWVATELAGVAVFNRFASRLAKSPPDLVTHLGLVRSSAYYEAGCPLELCDHAAARDLWRVIHLDAIGREGVCH